MPITAEAPRYAGQDHPCFGVQPVGWRETTRFMPWCFDGRVVRWGFACDTMGEARAVAVEMANHAQPRT